MIGRPNAGKSTLINRLIGDDRLLTGPEAGITRDSIIQLARDAGKTVREEAYSIDQWRADAASGKLLEKYNVVQRLPGGGGEYPLQDGFGWTNGVTRALIAKGFTTAQ